jgi:hypothetical protein
MNWTKEDSKRLSVFLTFVGVMIVAVAGSAYYLISSFFMQGI